MISKLKSDVSQWCFYHTSNLNVIRFVNNVHYYSLNVQAMADCILYFFAPSNHLVLYSVFLRDFLIHWNDFSTLTSFICDVLYKSKF